MLSVRNYPGCKNIAAILLGEPLYGSRFSPRTASVKAKAGQFGTLARSLDAIADQAKPITVLVRVAQGETEAENPSNIIGGVTADGKKTGMKALLSA